MHVLTYTFEALKPNVRLVIHSKYCNECNLLCVRNRNVGLKIDLLLSFLFFLFLLLPFTFMAILRPWTFVRRRGNKTFFFFFHDFSQLRQAGPTCYTTKTFIAAFFPSLASFLPHNKIFLCTRKRKWNKKIACDALYIFFVPFYKCDIKMDI